MQSKNFFWRLLSIEPAKTGGSGKLTSLVMHFFYRSVTECLQSCGAEVPLIEHVLLETMDSVKCRDPEGISYESIKKSPHGSTLMLRLLDVNAFLAHEARSA